MSTYSIIYLPSTEKFIAKAPPKLALRILDKVRDIASNPLSPHPNLTRLKEPLNGYRLRVGDYRVIYVLDHTTRRLIVTKIDHRSSVYL